MMSTTNPVDWDKEQVIKIVLKDLHVMIEVYSCEHNER
jgi:hypothetical protein